MAFHVPASNPHQKRTIRNLYSATQATPTACFLDPDYDIATDGDILPGHVMTRLGGEVVTKYTGAAGTTPYGLAAQFVAPTTLGIDEVGPTGRNLYSVWVGGNDAQFEVLAPAFDADADWTVPTDGTRVKLTGNANGELTPDGADETNAIAELIDVVGTNKIIISLDRSTFGAGA